VRRELIILDYTLHKSLQLVQTVFLVMLWRTHRRITERVSSELGLSNPEMERLLEGVLAPDLFLEEGRHKQSDAESKSPNNQALMEEKAQAVLTRKLDIMKILVFTEGTLMMHSSGIIPKGKSDWDKTVKNDSSIYDYSSYIPVKNSVKKLKAWEAKGAEILYLTSRRKTEEVQQIRNVLKRHGFPNGELFFIKRTEKYEDVIERVKPDVYIDDDCESIGGNDIQRNIDPRSNTRIIIVKEFRGIDHLPDNPFELFEVET
jgi:hypothetical protein